MGECIHLDCGIKKLDKSLTLGNPGAGNRIQNPGLGKLKSTFYGNLRQPELVNFDCRSPWGGGCQSTQHVVDLSGIRTTIHKWSILLPNALANQATTAGTRKKIYYEPTASTIW